MAFGNRDKTTHISSSLTSTRDVVGGGGVWRSRGVFSGVTGTGGLRTGPG